MANDELKKKVSVKRFCEQLALKQLAGDEKSLKRWIIAPDINRPGLELTGYKESGELKRVVVFGKKEHEYMKQFDYNEQIKRFNIITDRLTPCVVVSSRRKAPKALIDLANKKNFPVFEYKGKTYQLIVEAVSFLSEQLAPMKTVHGVMMNVYGVGVMLMGESGIGKSELALDLINRGHMLVADDSVEISMVHNRLSCTAPHLLKKMLEIRGLGAIDVTLTYGASSFLNKCNLNFVIHLTHMEDMLDYDRLNPITKKYEMLGVSVPMLEVPVSESKSLSVIIEAAVTNYLLNKEGIDANEIFKENVLNEIMRKNSREANDD